MGLVILVVPSSSAMLEASDGTSLLLLNNQQQQPAGLWISCSTSKGPMNVLLDPEHAPKSVEALLTLIGENWFSNKIAFFRVNKDAVQLGAVRKDTVPKLLAPAWERDLHPEPDSQKRKPDWIRGDVTMIGGTQMVIVRRNGTMMGMNDKDTVVGRIDMDSMERVVDRLYEYPDIIHHPKEHGPDQRLIFKQGWDYLDKEFPLVDYIDSCRRGYEFVPR